MRALTDHLIAVGAYAALVNDARMSGASKAEIARREAFSKRANKALVEKMAGAL
jgi:hypothetical protein